MRILYATDGSEGALAGAWLLSQLVLTAGSQVEILAVFGPGEDERREAALEATREALGPAAEAITTESRMGSNGTGPVVEQIVEAAEAMTADMIVVGTRGQSAIAKFFVGSVAENVARHAPCPVLLARPLVGTLDRVVVGLDGSEAALNAARWALTLPLPTVCDVRLVRLVTPPAYLESVQDGLVPPLTQYVAEALQREQEAARKALDEAAREFGGGGRNVVAEAVPGHAAAGLIDAARERDADLLVVGAEGLSGLNRFLLGSVSETVVRHAHCSVLVVKEPKSGA